MTSAVRVELRFLLPFVLCRYLVKQSNPFWGATKNAVSKKKLTGGSCWLKLSQDGKCTSIITRNVSKAECCSNNSNFGFSEKDASDAELFLITAFNTGATCSSCTGNQQYLARRSYSLLFVPPENCSSTTCDSNKRCHMRNGKPKCSCSFDCKSIQSARKVHQKHAENIVVEPEGHQYKQKRRRKDKQNRSRPITRAKPGPKKRVQKLQVRCKPYDTDGFQYFPAC